MMKYRIIEKANFSGEIIYYPQYRKYFIWWDFWDFNFPPRRIEYYSLESATKFIRKQQKNPEKKIYYIEQ